MDTQSLNAISLFSGAGGDTLGLTRAGFNVIGFNEFNKAAIQTHEANFPGSALIKNTANGTTDITKVPDSEFESYAGRVNLVFAGFPCFVKGTPVLTEKGYKPIETVRLTDTLLSHTGTFQPILNLQQKNYNGDLYSIRIRYHPDDIQATEEHPFYVRSSQNIWENAKRKYIVKYGEPEWKKANELKESDYFGMSVNRKEAIPSFTIKKKINDSRTDTVHISLDKPEEWFTMGYFVGDGWIEETTKVTGSKCHKIRFAIHSKDTQTVLSEILKVLPITDKKCNSGEYCSKYGCNNQIWFTILQEFGKYAHGKKIPEWVQDAPISLLQEFVRGYLSADGCRLKDERTRMTTVSTDLAFGFQRIFFKLGHVLSLQKTKRPETKVIEGRVVNQRDTYELEGRLVKKRQTNLSFIEGDYVWCKAFSIRKSAVTNQEVFNFEVETDNSYTVSNTLVHNCQGFSKAGKKQAADPRNQMFRQFVRVVKATKPDFVIGENVTGLTSMKSGPKEEDPLMLTLILQAFKEIGYDMSYQVLEATEFGVPQKRKRILLVGWKIASFPSLDPSSFWASVFDWGSRQTLPIQRGFVKPTLEGAYELKPVEVPEGFDDYAIQTTETEPTGKPHPFVVLKAGEKLLSCSKRVSPIHSEVIDLDKPSKTIICTYDHQPRLLVGLKSLNGRRYVRTLLPEELKQIQGFPAEYTILGNMKEQVVQIGNAVPPALVQGVALILRSFLEVVEE